MPAAAAIRNFVHALDSQARDELAQRLTLARQLPNPEWGIWRCGDRELGFIPRGRMLWLASLLAGSALDPNALVWNASEWQEQARSGALTDVLLEAKRDGLLSGWRNECFSFWTNDFHTPHLDEPPFFSVERAGFRFLGLLSHASHINGFSPDGRLWCGRRSLRKATDPGLLDNLAAGGIATGQTPEGCAVKELFEEAGLHKSQLQALQPAGWVRISEPLLEGWHDEVLHVFNLVVAADFQPENQDGEVDEFQLLTPQTVMAHIRAESFTRDAVLALATGLLPWLRPGIYSLVPPSCPQTGGVQG